MQIEQYDNQLLLNDDKFADPFHTMNNKAFMNISSKQFTAEQHQYYTTFNPFKQNIPKNHNFTVFQQSKWKLLNIKHQEIVTQLIAYYQTIFDQFTIDMQNAALYQTCLDRDMLIINQYKNQKNPRILFLIGISQLFKMQPLKKQPILDMILEAAAQTYPKALTILAFYQKNQNKKKQLLNKASTFGDKIALYYLGLYQQKNSLFDKAFQSFYYSGLMGSGIGWKKVSQYYEKGIGRKKDIKLSLKYVYKSSQKVKSQQTIDELLQTVVKLSIQINKTSNFHNQIKSTELNQARYVLNFIQNKQYEAKMIKQNMVHAVGMTNSTQVLTNYQNCIPKKVFIIVPTLLSFPSRGFLVQDQNGVIDQVYIYNWDKFSLQKYKLLFQLGTIIYLNYYIRKLGANDLLPMYRIQNPFWIQIQPRKKKHYLTNQKIRQLCKELFKSNFYNQCITLYDFIIKRKGQNEDVVYSNKCVCLMKLNQINQAKNSAQMSIKLNSKNQKSIYRLAQCYCIQNNYIRAKQIALTLINLPQKSALLKKINENLKLQQNSMNLNIGQYKKAAQKRTKKIVVLTSSKQRGPIIASEFGYYILWLINVVTPYLKMNNYSQFQKQEYTRKLIQKAANVQICQDNIKIMKDALIMTYEMINEYFTKNQKIPILDSSQNYVFLSNNTLNQKIYGAMFKQRQFSKFQKKFDQLAQDYFFDLLFKLSQRAYILENRIQNFCIQAQYKDNISLALKMYACAIPYNIQFSKNYSDLLLKAKNHKENIQFCQKMIKIVNKCTNDVTPYWNYIYFCLNKIKSMKQLRLQGSLQQAQHLYQFICKTSPDLTYKKYQKGLLSKKTELWNQHKKPYKADFAKYYENSIGSLIVPIVQLCKLISLIHYDKHQFNESMKYINIALQKNIQQSYELNIQKTRTLLKLCQYSGALKLIQLKLKECNKDKVLNQQIYKNVFYKLKLQVLAKLKLFQNFVQFSRDIVQLDYNNINFIQKKLAQLVKNNEEELSIVVSLLKKYDILQTIYHKFKIYLRAIQQERKEIQLKKQQQFQDNIRNQNDLQEINKFYSLQSNQQVEIIDFKQLQKHYKSLKEEIDQLDQQQTISDEFQELLLTKALLNQYKGFQSYFYHQKLLYVVIFDENLHVQKKEFQKFRQAAGKGFCKRFYGTNGIKILTQEFVELKINSGNRLTGKLIKGKDKILLYFNKMQNHQQIKKKI